MVMCAQVYRGPLTHYFLDSSALVKRYVPEVGTVWVRALAAPTAGHILMIAQVTPAEIVSGVRGPSQRGQPMPSAC